MAVVGKAEVAILPDVAQFGKVALKGIQRQAALFKLAGEDAGENVAEGLGKGFSRDVNGRLRDARGKFVTEGGELGQGLRKGLQVVLGKLRRDGEDAGHDMGNAVERGFRAETGNLTASIGGIAKLALGFGAAFAAAGVGKFLGSAISDASDLGEAVNKADVVFGDAAASVKAFADTSDKAFGISEAAALGYTGTFGNLLRSVGLTEDKSAEFSTTLVGLAADLGSFNNVSADEALEALRSGLTGETEPLKKFGVNLNEATLKAKALELGLLKGSVAPEALAKGQEKVRATLKLAEAQKKNGAESEEARRAAFDLEQANNDLAEVMEGKVPATLDAAAKAQAAYALIIEQTTLAQGDFARTAGTSLPNQLKILQASFTDLKAGVGEALLPIGSDFLKSINDSVLPALEGLSAALEPALAPIAALVEPLATALVGAVEAILPAVEALAPVFVNVVEAALPLLDLLGGVIDALAGPVGTAIQALVDAFGPVLEVAVQVGTILLEAFAPVLDTVAGIIGELGPLIGDFVTDLAPVFAQLAGSFGSIFTALAPVLEQLGGTLFQVITDLLSTIGPVVADLADVLGSVFEALGPIFADLLAQLGPILETLGGTLGEVLGTIARTLLDLFVTLAPVIAQVAEVLGGAFVQVLGIIAEVFGKLAPVIGKVAGVLAGALAAALPKLAAAFERLLPGIIEIVDVLANGLADVLITLVNVVLPLVPVFTELAVLFADVLVDVVLELVPIVKQLADTFAGTLAKILPKLIPIIQRLAPVLGRIVQLIGDLVTRVLAKSGPALDRLIVVFGDIVIAVLPVLDVLIDLVENVLDVLGPMLPELADAIAEMAVSFAELVEAILPLIPPLVKVVGFLVDDIAAPVIIGLAKAFVLMNEAITGLVNAVLGFASGAIEALTEFFSTLDELPGKVLGVLQNVVDAFVALPGALIGVAADVASGIATFAAEAFGVVLSTVTGLVGDVADALAGIAGDIAEAFGGVVDTVEGIVGDVVDAFLSIPTKLAGLVGDLLDMGKEFGGKILEGILDGLANVGSVVLDLGSAVVDALKAAWNTFVDFLNDATPDSIDLGGRFLPDIPLPDNPWNFLKLAKGGVASARSGGVFAQIAEAGTDEAVLPLPPGVLEGLVAIGKGGGSGPLVGQLNITEARSARETGRQTVRRLRSEAYLMGRR